MDAKRQLGFSRRAMAKLSAEGSQPTISALGKTSRRYGMLRPMPQPKSRTELTEPASCCASSIL
jgi:hypothetical protein